MCFYKEADLDYNNALGEKNLPISTANYNFRAMSLKCVFKV